MKENIRTATIEAMREERQFILLGTTHCAAVRLGFYGDLLTLAIVKKLRIIEILDFIELKLKK